MQIIKRNFTEMTENNVYEDMLGHFQVSYNSDGRITIRHVTQSLSNKKDILINLSEDETKTLIRFVKNYIK